MPDIISCHFQESVIISVSWLPENAINDTDIYIQTNIL
ncbi:hypothetical protein ECDEC5B_5540 [Escherichia coli DEC5B]|nr:hypothetical protein ECDEC5B_5540 [Escherichia coli DEC5B]